MRETRRTRVLGLTRNYGLPESPGWPPLPGVTRKTPVPEAIRNFPGSRKHPKIGSPVIWNSVFPESSGLLQVPGVIRSSPGSRGHPEYSGFPESQGAPCFLQTPGFRVPGITRNIPCSRSHPQLRIHGVTRNSVLPKLPGTPSSRVHQELRVPGVTQNFFGTPEPPRNTSGITESPGTVPGNRTLGELSEIPESPGNLVFQIHGNS